MTQHKGIYRGSSLVLTLSVLSVALSACASRFTPEPLVGRWVGTLDVGDDLRFMKLELESTWMGMSGSLDLLGTGRLELVKSSYNSTDVFFEMRGGDEAYAFTGESNDGFMIGHLHRSGHQLPFQLRRVPEINERMVRAFLGMYRVGSEWVRDIEECVDHFGSRQLMYVDARTGGRKALFPLSENTFFFGPGFLIPEPIEGTVTFFWGRDGRPHLVWDQMGSEVMIGQPASLPEEAKARPMVRGNTAPRCKPRSG